MASNEDRENEEKLRKALKEEAAKVQPSGKVKPALKKILDEGKKGKGK